MLLAIGHIEGLTFDDGWGGALRGPLVIKNTSTDRHCYATVVTNGWQGTVFYRFFLSSKNQPLVEVRRLILVTLRIPPGDGLIRGNTFSNPQTRRLMKCAPKQTLREMLKDAYSAETRK